MRGMFCKGPCIHNGACLDACVRSLAWVQSGLIRLKRILQADKEAFPLPLSLSGGRHNMEASLNYQKKSQRVDPWMMSCPALGSAQGILQQPMNRHCYLLGCGSAVCLGLN